MFASEVERRSRPGWRLITILSETMRDTGYNGDGGFGLVRRESTKVGHGQRGPDEGGSGPLLNDALPRRCPGIVGRFWVDSSCTRA